MTANNTKKMTIEITEVEISYDYNTAKTEYFVDVYEGRHEIHTRVFSTREAAEEYANSIS